MFFSILTSSAYALVVLFLYKEYKIYIFIIFYSSFFKVGLMNTNKKPGKASFKKKLYFLRTIYFVYNSIQITDRPALMHC